MRRKTARIGDICEISTPAGLAYVQYTHDVKGMGQLVRVLPGLFAERPDFEQFAKATESYFVFYTLDIALRDGLAEIVSHQPIPGWAQPYPLMRWTGLRDPGGRALAWKIFRASESLTPEMHQRTKAILTLTPEQEKLSVHVLRPHPIMVKELARGWTPQRAEELRLQDVAEAARRISNQPLERESVDDSMYHFLYFPTKTKAVKAGDHLRGIGFSVEIRKGADGKKWLALASRISPKTGAEMGDLRHEMEVLAEQFGGEYDGWQARVGLLSSRPAGRGEVN